jgi:hypothetical protein
MARQVIKATSDRFKLAAYLHGWLQRRTSAVESMLSTFPQEISVRSSLNQYLFSFRKWSSRHSPRIADEAGSN